VLLHKHSVYVILVCMYLHRTVLNSLVAKETGVLAGSGLIEQSGKITAANCFGVPSLFACADKSKQQSTHVT
jgi:hypothetical protein